MQNYMHETGVPFLSVEYRLAPKFPVSIPVEDSSRGLEWLHSNASKPGANSNRIAVMGDSGGGVLQPLHAFGDQEERAKDWKQVLIYPMLDDRNTIPDENLVLFATWGYNDSATG